MSGVEVIDGVVADLGLVLDNERREIVLSARAGPEQLRAASVPPSRFETMPKCRSATVAQIPKAIRAS